MKKTIFLGLCLATALADIHDTNAAPVEYRINLTQTAYVGSNDAEHLYGVRPFSGGFTIDDSFLGPSNVNRSYLPSDFSAVFTAFWLKLDNGTLYEFDPINTQSYNTWVDPLDHFAGVKPLFPTILTIGPSGEALNVQGVLKVPGSLTEVVLGGDGFEGTYKDWLQVNPNGTSQMTRGVYTIQRTTPFRISEPGMFAIFGFALAGLGVMRRRRRAA